MNKPAAPNEPPARDVRARHLLLLVAACLGLWCWTCGLWDLWGPDESRYVLVARELLPRHNWFLLTLYGQPYDQKPPLPFWLIAAMLKLNGGAVSNLLVRLPSILFGMLAVVATYSIGRRLWGARAGLMAGFILLTAAQFLKDAPTAELNVMFTGWTALALGVWFSSDLFPGGGGRRAADAITSTITRNDYEHEDQRQTAARAQQSAKWGWGRTALFWGAVAGAFFTKGPLVLLFVISALGGAAWAARSARPLRVTRPLAGLAGVLALAGLWLWLQARTAGGEFVATQVKGQTLERFLHGSHEEPFYYYLPRLFTSIFAPWGVFLIPAALRLKRLGRAGLPAGMGALLGWGLPPFLVFMLANGKREAYLLPLLPALALIVAWYFDRCAREGKAWPVLGWVLGLADLVAGGVLAAVAALLAVKPGLGVARGVAFGALGVGVLALAGAGLAALGAWSLRNTRRPALTVANLTATMLIMGLVLFSAVNPALNPWKTTRPLAQRLDAMLQGRPDREVGALGKADKPEYHVYGNYRVMPFTKAELAETTRSLPGLMVARGDDWEDVPQSVSRQFRLAWHGEVSRDKLEIYEKMPVAR